MSRSGSEVSVISCDLFAVRYLVLLISMAASVVASCSNRIASWIFCTSERSIDSPSSRYTKILCGAGLAIGRIGLTGWAVVCVAC